MVRTIYIVTELTPLGLFTNNSSTLQRIKQYLDVVIHQLQVTIPPEDLQVRALNLCNKYYKTKRQVSRLVSPKFGFQRFKEL